ncbi:ArdC-like ssDNA-binding domain-containing protein [Rosistilla oblonga]|uniref:ArdC-like ssDNA-binding domain-containing protein n=1 Tax=Rosistilla oblonga TaxID=2527990 RepID=UPI003A9726B7
MSVSSPASVHKSSVDGDYLPMRVKQFTTQKAASEHIAAILRSGMIPWKNDVINDRNNGLPLCVVTQVPYSPINILLLQISARKQSFASRNWGTRSIWQELGGDIDESKVPTIVLDDDWGPFEVFCVDQVSGAKTDRYRVHANSITTADNSDYSLLEKLVESSGADIRIGVGDGKHSVFGDWYVPPNPWVAFPFHSTGDYILLQRPELRSSIASHYHTLLHEFIHWAEVRTNWIDDMRMRELVAEIGSGWLATELGSPPCPCRTNEDKWLERWLWEMNRDPEYVIRAAAQAWTATQFILSILEERKPC